MQFQKNNPYIGFVRRIFQWAVFALLAAGTFACQAGAVSSPTPSASVHTIAVSSPAPVTPIHTAAVQPTTIPSTTAQLAQEFSALTEVPVQDIPLSGLINRPESELSGLAWDQDTLLLLPQYPERFTLSAAENSDGAIFALSKSEILAFLDGTISGPLEPALIPIYANGLKQKLAGYEGYESILVLGDQIFLTIETHQIGGMVGILLAGEFNEDHSEIHIDTSKLEDISAQAAIANFSDEALTLVGGHLLTFYEANGAQFNPTPVAHLFDLDLNPQGVILSPNLEYRITDASLPDKQGRFWVINYFFPGDTKIAPITDPIKQKYGIPSSYEKTKIVERLVQFQWNDNQISLVDRAPIYLKLLPGDTARNWEGLAQLDERGFLLVTDQYPVTLLSFVSIY